MERFIQNRRVSLLPLSRQGISYRLRQASLSSLCTTIALRNTLPSLTPACTIGFTCVHSPLVEIPELCTTSLYVFAEFSNPPRSLEETRLTLRIHTSRPVAP